MTDDVEVDLFGNPVQPMRDFRGRPQYKKSAENQQLVTDLRAGGMTHTEIATCMGCDEKTLRKHFSRELQVGATLAKGQAIQVLMQKMRDGNLTATRAVLDMTEARPAPVEKPKPEPQLGKKEQAQRDAADVPDGWGDLLPDGPTH